MTRELTIDNKVYYLDFVEGDDKTLLFCDTYDSKENIKNIEHLDTTQLIGWCWGRDYELDENFINEMKETGNTAYYQVNINDI